MTENGSTAVISKKTVIAAVIIAIIAAVAVFVFSGPHYKTGAEKRVADELDALKHSETVGSEVVSLRESLSDEGKEDFDGFLKKLRDFDYEITGVKESGDADGSGEDTGTVVSVKIRTYDFGREYLATWTDYLKSHKDALQKDADLIEYYEDLFDRLDDLDKKECIKTVDIVCADPLHNEEWIADIKDNEELQDAIFGGMMSEMKTLAEE